MNYQIKNLQGEIIFEAEGDSLKAVVELAVKQGANLEGANLKGANLRWANLEWANLEDANLEGTNLYGANPNGADLKGTNLEGANLKWANLEDANLKGTNLKGAYLKEANIYGANLEDANLEGTNLEGANLRLTNLEGARLPHFQIVPECGSFLAFKKLSSGVIVQVLIPAHAERTSSLIGRKCRSSEVIVRKIIEGEIPEGIKIKSTSYGEAVYAVGETVKADKWDGDILVECTHGIHFFMTLKEAQEWS